MKLLLAFVALVSLTACITDPPEPRDHRVECVQEPDSVFVDSLGREVSGWSCWAN